jgi:phospholipid-binding lipoprotein MlaA
LYEDVEDDLSFPDPFERMNRGTFAFNMQVDRFVLDPLMRAYDWVMPNSVERGIRNFFLNLNSPSVFVNDLLQREWRDAAVTITRTGVNTTAGLFGIFDSAARIGLERHHSDFGQTLALAGLGSGPYVVMPILGPTNFRDGFGVIVDFAFRPTTYLLGSTLLASTFPPVGGASGAADQLIYSSIQGGGAGLVEREKAQEELEALRESSVDFYATLGTAYYQNRVAAIWYRRERHHAIRERAVFIHRCQSSRPRFSRAGTRKVRRILPASSQRCSPTDAAQARSRSL